MKIVHLSTSDMGGAGIAAKRLHVALLDAGVDSHLVTKFGFGPPIPHHTVLRKDGPKSLAQRIQSRFDKLFGRQNHDPHSLLAGRRSGFEHFSFPYPGEDLRALKQVRAADILHLHWVADGMLDYKKFFRSLKQPVVWTLHDMNPFTGGCHHADGWEGFTSDCSDCPQLAGTADTDMARRNLQYKTDAISRIGDRRMQIVTPSSWLGSLSKKSRLFSRFQHHVVPNVCASKVFDIRSKKECRDKLGLPANAFVVLCVANDIDNARKGIHFLVSAINELQIQDLIVCTVGKGLVSTDIKFPLRNLGFVRSENDMVTIYNTADVFVLPSVAENFPNTVAESLLCGVAVAATDTGGIAEQIDLNNGRLFARGDVNGLKNAILHLYDLRDQTDRSAIRRSALDRFSDELSISGYLRVYENGTS